MICGISFCKFLDVLPNYIYAKATDKILDMFLEVHILRCAWSKTLAMPAKSEGRKRRDLSYASYLYWASIGANGNIPLLKPSKHFLYLQKVHMRFEEVILFLLFFLRAFWFYFFIKIHNFN